MESPDDGQTVTFSGSSGMQGHTREPQLRMPTIGQNLQETVGHLSQHLSQSVVLTARWFGVGQ